MKFFTEKFLLRLLPIIGVLLLFVWWGVSWGTVKGKSLSENLVAENQRLRQFVYEMCEDLQFSEPRCYEIFPEFAQTTDDLASRILDLVDLYFVNYEDNAALRQRIIELSRTQKNPIADNELPQILVALQEENTQKYLQDFGIAVATKSEQIALTNAQYGLTLRYDQSKGSVWTSDDLGKSLNFSALTQLTLLAQVALAEDNEKFSAARDVVLPSKEQQTYLFLGQSGDRYDTIMLANVNEERRQITLVSLPRDLWLDGRRINILAHWYGIDYFIEQVEKICGVKLAGYAAVDMFAFPEIIDELGGIDFEFAAPLIDPTYKTVDNGVVGTLYFPAGRSHLNGIQALRVARSRHTSSDFSRAERQQAMLSAVKQRLAELGMEKTLWRTLPIFIKKVQTDIGYLQTWQLARQAKDYELRIGAVMSTQNILHSEMIDLGDGQLAYALKPKDNDWDLLKIFITNAFYAD